MRYCQF